MLTLSYNAEASVATFDAIKISWSPKSIGLAAATTAAASIRFEAQEDTSNLSVASFINIFSQVMKSRTRCGNEESLAKEGRKRVACQRGSHLYGKCDAASKQPTAART